MAEVLQHLLYDAQDILWPRASQCPPLCCCVGAADWKWLTPRDLTDLSIKPVVLCVWSWTTCRLHQRVSKLRTTLEQSFLLPSNSITLNCGSGLTLHESVNKYILLKIFAFYSTQRLILLCFFLDFYFLLYRLCVPVFNCVKEHFRATISLIFLVLISSKMIYLISKEWGISETTSRI